jgi:hypothetical protein
MRESHQGARAREAREAREMRTGPKIAGSGAPILQARLR